MDLVATGQNSIHYTHAFDLRLDALHIVRLAIDVLLEDIAHAFAINIEAGDKLLSTAQWRSVIDGDTADHDINALVVQFFEADADALDEFVAGHFEVVLVIGVVDNALDVAFVIASLQF